jgi:hypothetical protein
VTLGDYDSVCEFNDNAPQGNDLALRHHGPRALLQGWRRYCMDID